MKFGAEPIISCALRDGQALVSIRLFDKAGQPVLSVVDNEVAFRLGALWDFRYGHNWAEARSGPRDIALQLDFRGDRATIDGKLWLGGKQILLRPDYTSLPGNNLFKGGQISGCAVGIQIT